ncbi:hypothetical protein [Rheinheimera texasensis]|uniref:hypothetical protein n=1 Tax=Rheinheimera texasensis TaxID=306205 RepID=UPI000AA6CDE5|nr:hypothetical protein [Rheinheimera texasensis]
MGKQNNTGLVCALIYVLALQTISPALAETANGWTYSKSNEFGANLVREDNLFWRMSEQFAPDSQFDTSTHWLELYLEPGFAGQYQQGRHQFYGEISVVATGTLGTDAFANGDTGRVTIEDAYVGYRRQFSDHSRLDVSAGAQEFSTGSGMLISNGGSSGFERGALKFGPRKAWKNTMIARVQHEQVEFSLFSLSPNDLDSNITNTDITGIDFRISPESIIKFAGVTAGKITESLSPYPQAGLDGVSAPTIIEKGRDGLKFVYGYTKMSLEDQGQRVWTTEIDISKETHEILDMAADAARLRLGVNWQKQKWQPTITYTYQQFSGDDPFTATLERFDPLYYEGSPNAWSSGSKSSMMFINSNLRVHQLAVRWLPGAQHILTFRIARVLADELRSPIQFGQATRLDLADGLSSVVTGVNARHLSDDYFIEYNHIINRNNYLNFGAAIARPGEGIKQLLTTDQIWTGGFVNFVSLF